MAAAGGFWRRLRNFLLWCIGAGVAGSVLAVLLLRWVPPLSSAFIAHDYLDAWLARDFAWRADHRWTPYERISRHVKLAVSHLSQGERRFRISPCEPRPKKRRALRGGC